MNGLWLTTHDDIGSAVGPIIGGFITVRTNWRWLFYIVAILQGLITVGSFFSYEETYSPLLLKRKAKAKRERTGNLQLYTTFEQSQKDESAISILKRSFTRPVRLLTFHPIMQVISLVNAFNYGILYLVISTFIAEWTTRYRESIAISGLNFIAFVVGELTAANIGVPLSGRIWRLLQKRASGSVTPEYRVPLMIPGAILLPIGLFMYGWAAQAHAFWLVPDIGVAIIGCGLLMGTQARQAYVIDAYPDHTSSANAASQFLSSIAAFAFPLFGPKMYETLGFGWGNSLLAFAAIAIGLPAPMLIWTYGARLRAKAKSSY